MKRNVSRSANEEAHRTLSLSSINALSTSISRKFVDLGAVCTLADICELLLLFLVFDIEKADFHICFEIVSIQTKIQILD